MLLHTLTFLFFMSASCFAENGNLTDISLNKNCNCPSPPQGPPGPPGPQGEQGEPGPPGTPLPFEGFKATLPDPVFLTNSTDLTNWDLGSPGSFDNGGNFNPATGIYLVPETGIYSVSATLSFFTNDEITEPGELAQIRLQDPNTSIIYETISFPTIAISAGGSPGLFQIQVKKILELDAGVELQLFFVESSFDPPLTYVLGLPTVSLPTFTIVRVQ